VVPIADRLVEDAHEFQLEILITIDGTGSWNTDYVRR
jgi:hypothetical protein